MYPELAMAYHGNAVIGLNEFHHDLHLLLEIVPVNITNGRIP
jgi:hypothetical protein